MKLRARSSAGVKNVAEKLDININNISDLYEDLKAKFGLETVSVRCGFPLKPLEGHLTTLLVETGLKDGDVLVIEGSSACTATAAGPNNANGTATAAKPNNANSTATAAIDLPGCVVVREMADDNSCLFRSIAYLFLNDSDRCSELRKVIADEILKNQLIYSSAILGKDPKSYCEWILRSNSWGGAIELAIFSDYFNTCIISLDISSGRLDRFGEGKYSSAAFVLYSGIHYDSIVVSPTKCADEFDMKIFSQHDIQKVEDQVVLIGRQWKNERRFTDLGSFTIKCGICSQGLKGQKDAQNHALSTGHKSFVEY